MVQHRDQIFEDLHEPGLSDHASFDLAKRLSTPVWVYDIDRCRILHANQAACQVWQAETEAELQARDLREGMSSTVAKRLMQYQSDFRDSDATFNELWTLYPKGVATNVMVVFSGFKTRDGRMAMLCEVVEGLDSENPDNLRSTEALLHTDVMISLFSMEGPPLYQNPAARNVTGDHYMPFHQLFADPEDYTAFMFDLDRAGEHRAVSKVRTAVGLRWYDLSAKFCSDAVTGDPALLLTAFDVSELKNARDRARYLADRDMLTGCFNRAYLQQHMINLSKRTDYPCAAVYFDIDHFKAMNDQFGHDLGDHVLKEISDRARANIRKRDVLVRLGGDEFVILLEDVDLKPDNSPELDRLLSVFSKPIYHDAVRVNATVSMGVSLFRPNEADYASVLREADIALYKSKADGRCRWTLYDEKLGLAAEERRMVEMDIKRAIENKEFILHFQPRVDLSTGRIVSAEALVRWQHPDRGLILPGHFIPLCEETGMILELGHQILNAGCEQAFEWSSAGHDIDLSINISPRQFDDGRLMASLKHFSSLPGFPKHRIELEITEGVLIGNLSKIEAKLKKIRSMGFRIAIDDFGTGYSNLAYISRFPLNCLKVDRSFIQQLPQSGPIISLILTLAHQVGANCVAEGVENESETEWLTEHGCDEGQGYFYSPPVDLGTFEALLEQGFSSSIQAR